MRIRIKFSKTEAMRYTSHLDLLRAWERTLRRASIPMLYSQGFNPRPRIQSATALPLGMTSECELIDVWLAGELLSLEEISASLLRASPPGILLSNVIEVNPEDTALQNLLRSSAYEVTLLDRVDGLAQKVDSLLACGSLLRQWRGKTYDLRPLMEHLSMLDQDTHQKLVMVLSAREGRTARPEEVLAALVIPLASARIHRKSLQFETPAM
jgi:radical SAM-linked protein